MKTAKKGFLPAEGDPTQISLRMPRVFFDHYGLSRQQLTGQRAASLENELSNLKSYATALETEIKDASNREAR
jgi:hypothetical protein